MSEKNTSILKGDLKRIVNLECWSAIAGAPSGSRISFKIGAKVKRETPIQNSKLTEEERNYQGEFRLFIECCRWRLRRKFKVICDSSDDNREGKRMLKGLKKIVGKTIRYIRFRNGKKDLKILFDDDYVFATWPEPDLPKSYEKYTLFTPERWVTVFMEGKIKVEGKEKN